MRTSKTKQRFIAALLTLVMLVTLVPADFINAFVREAVDNNLNNIISNSATTTDALEPNLSDPSVLDPSGISPSTFSLGGGASTFALGTGTNKGALDPYITVIVVQVTENGVTQTHEIQKGSNVDINASKNANIKLEYKFGFSEDVILNDGDKFTLDVDTTYINISGGNQTLEYKDGSGNILAYLHISENGSAVFEVTQALAERTSNRNGSCYFEYSLNGDAIGEQEEVEIDLLSSSANTTITLKPTENQKTPPTISKGVNYTKTSGNETCWTVTVVPGQNYDTTGLEIAEILPSNTTISDIRLVSDTVNWTSSNGTIILNENITAPITFEIITETDVNNSILNTKLENTVKIKTPDNTEINSSTSERWYNPNVISKSGSYDADSNSITWTIIVNEDELDLKGVSISDNFDSTKGIITSATINGTSVTDLTFPYVLGDISDKQTIIYKVEYNETLTSKVSNNARITVGANTKDTSAEAGPDKTDYTYITKGCSWDNYYTKWTIIVNPNAETTLKNPVITDTLPEGAILRDNTIYVNGDAKTVIVDSDGKITYDFAAEITAEQIDDETIKDEYIITYYTHVDYTKPNIQIALNNNAQFNWVNKVNLSADGVDKDVEYTRWGQSVSLLDKTFEGFDYKTNEISWKVVVNDSKGELTDCVISDIIKDTQELNVDSILIKKIDIGGYESDVTEIVKANAASSASTEKFDLYIGDASYNTYIITYTTTVKDTALPKDETESKVYKNEVELISNQIENFIAEAETSAIKGLEGVKKSGTLKNNGEGITESIAWTVEMNKLRQTIPDGTTMVDIIPPGLELDETIIELYECEVNASGGLVKTGNKVTLTNGVNYTYDKFLNEFKVTLPAGSSSAYSLYFETLVVGDIDEATNTARFNMQSPAYTDTTTVDNINSSNAGVIIEGGYGTVRIKKVDSLTAELLDGAVFEVYDANKNKIGTLNATVSGITEWTQAAVNVKYYIREITAPEGYNPYNEFIEIELDTDGQLKEITVENTMKSEVEVITISKTDAETDEELAGASLAIYKKADLVNAVREWTTTSEAKIFTTLVEGETPDLPAGEYVLREVTPPSGYAYSEDIGFTVGDDGKVSITDAEGNVSVITMSDNRLSLTIEKRDGKDNQLLGGAILVLKDNDGNIVRSFESEFIKGEEITFTDLVAGETYTLEETAAPDGYVIADPITFTISRDGSIVRQDLEAVSNNTIIMIDDEKPSQTVKIEKVDGDGEQLAGASLVIQKKGVSTDLITFTSTKTPKEFTIVETNPNSNNDELAPGNYVLIEIRAPAGYKKAAAIEFTINADESVSIGGSNVSAVTMVDETFDPLYISKRNAENKEGTELGGAEFRITDSSKVVIESWTSGTTPHKLNQTLFKSGEIYTLTETKAPNNYKITQPIKFTISDSGVIILDSSDDSRVGVDLLVDKYDGSTTNNRLIMYDTPISPDSIIISKKAVGEIDELPGATLEIRDLNEEPLITWVTTSKAHEILINSTPDYTNNNELAAGTYYLVETAAPYGYSIEEKIKFTVSATGTISSVQTASTIGSGLGSSSVLLMRNAVKTLTLSKKILNGGDHELAGAQLVLKKGEDVVENWTSGTPKKLELGTGSKQLAPGEYTFEEISAPAGYKVADPISITITDDSKILVGEDEVTDNTITMYDETAPTLQISKQAIGGANELAGATLVISDSINGNELFTWTSGTTPQSFTIGSGEGQLAPGTYRLEEKVAPKGYAYAEGILFTVNASGKITTHVNGEVNDEKTILTMKDNPIFDLLITKYEAGKTDGLAGATFRIYEVVDGDISNTIVQEWRSTTSAQRVLGNKFYADKTYALVEVTPPAGYATAETVYFKVDKNGIMTITSSDGDTDTTNDPTLREVIGTYNMKVYDKPLVLAVDKLDVDDNYLSDAVLGIRVKGTTGPGAIIEGTAVTTAGANISIDTSKLRTGIEYELVETAAPTGYEVAQPIAFIFNSDGTITRTDGKSAANNAITIYNYAAGITFLKVDENGNPLQGVTLKITSDNDEDFNEIEWTSSDAPYNVLADEFTVSKTYRLSEVKAIPGYIYSNDIVFRYNSNQTVTIIEGEGYNTNTTMVKMTNTPFEIYIGKTNFEGDTLLDGAKFKIIKTNDKTSVVDSWTSDDKDLYTVDMSELEANEKYTLVEMVAPKGYMLGGEITFTIDKKGKIVNSTGSSAIYEINVDSDTIMVKNETLRLFIAKTDEEGNFLPGATLELRDSKDELLETIITDGDIYEVDFTKLEGGKTYTLLVNEAPKGYEIADPITFTIGTDGSITRADGKVVDDLIIEMIDMEEVIEVEEPEPPVATPTDPKSPVATPTDPEIPTNPEKPQTEDGQTSTEEAKTPDVETPEITVPDSPKEDTPKTDGPKTGDTVPIKALSTILLISMIGIIYCFFRKRRV